jgi:hypothetical protein
LFLRAKVIAIEMMMQRWFNRALIAGILLGGLLAWQSGQERTRLQAEYRRLSAITGELAIDDPAKLSIRAIDTGEPLHFAWRVYVPPNYRQIVKRSTGGSSRSSSSSSRQFIARVRFRLDEQGYLSVYSRFAGSSTGETLGDRRLGELLQGGWNKIEAMQLGAGGAASLAAGDSAVLLRLTLPPEMQEAARQGLPADMQNAFVPVLYELTLGPQTAMP